MMHLCKYLLSIICETSDLRIADTICCASTKVNPNDFPIENSTAEIDSEFVRQPCGHIKVDPETLPPAVEKIVGGKPAALGTPNSSKIKYAKNAVL